MAVDGYRISETGSGSSQEVKDKKTYSVHEIAQILQISRSKAYELRSEEHTSELQSRP